MNNSTYRKTLDVQKHGSQFTVNTVKGDSATRTLVLNIVDGGKPFDFGSGAIGTIFTAVKADGTQTTVATLERKDNVVTLTLPAGAINVAGDVKARIKLTAGENQVLYSPEFTIYVDDCAQTDGAAAASGDFTDLEEAIQEAAGAANVNISAERNLADTGINVTVTNREGESTTVTVNDGVDGQDGAKGDKGDKGDTGATGAAGVDGQDGFSPVATVVRGTNKATITITDKNGTTSADVYDGQGGTDLPLTPLSLSPITSTALSSLADGTYIVTDEGTISTTAGGGISFVEGAIIAVQSDSGAKHASVINGLNAGYLSDQDDTEIELYAIPADLENFVTQSDMSTALNLKANKATTYTKTEVNTLLDGKVSSSSASTIWTGTQNEYDAITTKDSDTLYFIVEASS